MAMHLENYYMQYLSEYHPPNIDRSSLPDKLYNGHEVVDNIDDVNFCVQFEELIDTLYAQALSIEIPSSTRELEHLLALKTKVREKSLTGTKEDEPYYYPYLKQTLEEFFLLLQEGKNQAQQRAIFEKYLLPDLYVCGPGLLTHKQRALTNSKAGIHYQAFLASHRELMIDALAASHIKYKWIAQGNEIHVPTFIAQYLAEYHFTRLQPLVKDGFANEALCKVNDEDLKGFKGFVRDQYIPSKIIPELAVYLQHQFAEFFKIHGLPYDAANPDKLILLNSHFAQLGIDLKAFFSIMVLDEDNVIHSNPTTIDIKRYLFKQLIAERPFTEETLLGIPVITVNDTFYDEITDEDKRLASAKKLMLVKITREELEEPVYGPLSDHLGESHFFTNKEINEADLTSLYGLDQFTDCKLIAAKIRFPIGTTLNAEQFKKLCKLGISDFSNTTVTEPIDLKDLLTPGLILDKTQIKLKPGTELNASRFIALADCGLTNFEHVIFTQTVHYIMKSKGIFTGASVKNGVELDSISFMIFCEYGIKNFRGVKFKLPLKPGAFKLKWLPDLDLHDTNFALPTNMRLTDSDFQFLYKAGYRNFRQFEIHRYYGLDFTGIDIDSCDFTGTEISIAQDSSLTHQQFQQLLKLGVKDFSRVTITELVDLDDLLKPGIRIRWDTITFKENTELTPTQFENLYAKGVRKFKNIILSEAVDAPSDRYLSFAGSSVKSGVRLNNNQFQKLYAASMRKFSGVIFTEPLHVIYPKTDLSGASFTLQPGITLNAADALKLYREGLRKFAGCICDSSAFWTLYDEGLRDFNSMHLIWLTNRSGTSLIDSNFNNCTIDEVSQIALHTSNITDFSTMTIENVHLSFERLNRLITQGITKFRHLSTRADLSKISLSAYHFQDCNFKNAKLSKEDEFYAHLRFSFRETLICLLNDYVNFSNPIHYLSRHHLAQASNALKKIQSTSDQVQKGSRYANELLTILSDEMRGVVIKPESKLMQRIRLAVSCHSDFDNEPVDAVMKRHFPQAYPADATVLLPAHRERSSSCVAARSPEAAAGAGAELCYPV